MTDMTDKTDKTDITGLTDMTVKLILASSSPRRQELIRMLDLPYEIKPSHVDENIAHDIPPENVVKELAFRKASATAENISNSTPEKPSCEHPSTDTIIIGADTIVVVDGHILGKPRHDDEAFTMLQMLQGRTHHVVSGVACIGISSGKKLTACRQTAVTMKPLSDASIRAYIKTEEPMDKAGAYAVQGIGATFVEHLDGDYFNVVGLPLSLLSDMLAEFDVHIL
jgi:septum formation protein